MLILAAWVGFLVFLFVGCVLVDVVCCLVQSIVRRRRLRRLRTCSVVRPRLVVLPSPDRRGECSPRLAAAHTRRRHP